MAFSGIEGQAKALALLEKAISRGRIPSAYLFLGPHHVGKRTTALELAKTLNCAGGIGIDGGGDVSATAFGSTAFGATACGACPSCRKITEGMHPDVDTVSPDGQNIKIDQIRGISSKLGLVPFEARKRVVILAQADRMNPQAANAFLKTLEEPPADTLLVLCVEDVGRLPETIISRCVPIRFQPLPPQTVARLLAGDRDWPPEVVDFAVRFAKGTLRPALREKAPHWLALRDEMVWVMEGLSKPVFPQVSERFAKWSGSDDWRFVLEWLETWFRDVGLVQNYSRDGMEVPVVDSDADNHGGGLINGDCLSALSAFARKFTPEAVEAGYRRVIETRDAIANWNANKTLTLEAMWLGFRDAA